MDRWPFVSERGVLTPISLHAILIIIRGRREPWRGPSARERQLRGPNRPPRSCARLRRRCRLLVPRRARPFVRKRTGCADGLRVLHAPPGRHYHVQVSCCLKLRHARLFFVDARSAPPLHHSEMYRQVCSLLATVATPLSPERG